MFPLPTPRAHFRGGVPPIVRFPRDKHVALGATGLLSVNLLQYYDRTLHVLVGNFYLEVDAVKYPPLTPPTWGSELQPLFSVARPGMYAPLMQGGGGDALGMAPLTLCIFFYWDFIEISARYNLHHGNHTCMS